MSIKDKPDEQRLAEGYYKQYQVHIDSGPLSLTLLNQLHTAFELSLRRFPDCCIFRCRLRIPKTFHGDTEKLLNTWFYRLAYKQKKESINMLRAKEITDDGVVSYRIVFIFDAVPHRNRKSLEQIKALYTQRVRKSWAKAVSVNDADIHRFCIIPSKDVMTLNTEQDDYDYNVRECFYNSSLLARLPRLPIKDIDAIFDCKFSKTHKQTERKAATKSS